MSDPQTKPHTYNEYETPPKWLIFIHYHDPKVPKLIRMTARILGDLSVMEGHASLAALSLTRKNGPVFSTSDITGMAGRIIASSLMRALVKKGILMQVSIPKDRENHVGASKTRWWQMRPDSQAKILTVETNLADLIKRAEHAERKGLGLAAK